MPTTSPEVPEADRKAESVPFQKDARERGNGGVQRDGRQQPGVLAGLWISLKGHPGLQISGRFAGMLALVLVVVLSSGCGATLARARVSGAQAAMAGAKASGAEELAPYEFTAALLYLEKAMEMEAYARFGPAIHFGGLSEKLAKEAREKAVSAEPDLAAQ